MSVEHLYCSFTVDEEKASRTVFLKNIPYEANHEEIRKVFNDCGEIESLTPEKHFRGYHIGFIIIFIALQNVWSKSQFFK